MLQERVRMFIEKNDLIEPEDRLAVAFSGGPDSACMLMLLRKMYPETEAIYINHGLRGVESAAEERFVRNFCLERGIRLHVESLQWTELPANLEEAARRKRFRHLSRVAAEQNIQKIALGHHLDDVAETFLLRLVRGTGPAGLSGIPARRGTFIRPMLQCTRAEILDYLQRNHIPYFTDTSNERLALRRNRIRHDVLPYLKKHFNPKISEALSRTSSSLKEQNRLLELLLEPYDALLQPVTQGFEIDQNSFMKLSPVLQKTIVRRAANRLDASLHLSRRTSERALKTIRTGGRMELPGFLMIESETNAFRILLKSDRVGYFEIDVPREGDYVFGPANARLKFNVVDKSDFRPEETTAYLDYDRASFPLYVRNWKRGDAFRPLGMPGRKKLSDFFIDLKIERRQRKKIPLVFKNDDLIWVAGHRIDERYRVTDATEKILKIELSEADV